MTVIAEMTYWRRVPTPAGPLLVFARGDEIRSEWAALHEKAPEGRQDRRLLPKVAAWVRGALCEVVGPPPVPVADGPPFHAACWRACRRIRVGRTRTYADLARAAGRPLAARAAGGAMRSNPQPLFTPCHRVLGSSGLGGFHGTARRGTALALKARLIQLESDVGR